MWQSVYQTKLNQLIYSKKPVQHIFFDKLIIMKKSIHEKSRE